MVNKKHKNLILACKKYFNQYFMYMLSPYLIFKQKDDIKAIHKGRKFTTIANMQWFSEEPSPLNGMVGGKHWDQWFSNGFGVRQPLETMVFDGCAPLVRRWNGYVPSLKSNLV